MTAVNQGEILTQVLNEAKATAKKWGHEQFSAAHLMYAVMQKGTGMTEMLNSWDVDAEFFSEWAVMILERLPRSVAPVDFPPADEKALNVLEEAERVRLRLGVDYVDGICVLVALISPGIVFSIPQLKVLPITDKELVEMVTSRSFTLPQNGQDAPYLSPSSEELPTGTVPWCINWRTPKIIEQGKLTMGRDREIRTMAEALNRHQNTGILIVGDAGVGKTALLKAYVTYLDSQNSADQFVQANVLKLDVSGILAGCSSPGEVESRLTKVFAKARKLSIPVLMIDELNVLLDDKSGMNNVHHTLNAALNEGGLAIIATTTTENFTKKIEPQQALLRKLEVIKISEPDTETAIKCMGVHRLLLQEHHKLQVEPASLAEATHLAKRYFKERKLPDSAINLLDRTLSALSQSNAHSLEECKLQRISVEKLKREFEQGVNEEEVLAECRWLNSLLRNKISPVMLGQLSIQTDPADLTSAGEYLKYLKAVIAELTELASVPKDSVSPVEIASMVAHQTGIPMGKIRADEKQKLLNLEEHLKRRVVGQDQAIRSLADAIIESRSGLNAAGKPIGSFFFLGPTGTGKTELGKTLAEFLFDDESAMIRFDMSEFKEEHSAALLYGAPPGYVGYEEGGLLVNKIRQQPYSVVLFDEIEKAHPSVFDIFLQIMDEGHIHDRLGKKGSFVDAIIIFTSNIGSDWISGEFRKGLIPTSGQLIEIMAQHFRPEFLGRLTEVVPFGPISEEVVVKIFDIHLRALASLLESRGIALALTDAARLQLAKAGYSERYGARPIASVIRNQVRRPISRKIVAGEIGEGTQVKLDIDQAGALSWQVDLLSPTPEIINSES